MSIPLQACFPSPTRKANTLAVQFHLSSLGSVSFFTVNASPINSGTAAVTVVYGLYQEDVAKVPAVEPAVQPDVPKPEEVSTQALSLPTLHPMLLY